MVINILLIKLIPRAEVTQKALIFLIVENKVVMYDRLHLRSKDLLSEMILLDELNI